MPIDQVIKRLQCEADTEIQFRPGVSEELIRKVEEVYSIILPDDVKKFYRFTNGFDTDDYMFNIIPMEDMIEGKVKYESEFPPLAEYLIYTETWHLEISIKPPGYSICIMDAGKKVTLTHALAEFLQRFLDGGLFGERGLAHWPEHM